MHTPYKIMAVLLLSFALCDVTSAQLSQRVQGLFSRFFNSARVQPKATCDWLNDPSLLKELKWKERVELVFESGPGYEYPEMMCRHIGKPFTLHPISQALHGGLDVTVALRNDPAAAEFLNYLTQCYNYQNQTYYRGWNQRLYTQDLCPVRARTVQMVRRHNHIDHRMDHCYIVQPDVQRVQMAQCGDGSGHKDAQKCKRDELSYFQGNYYCVPDGYVQRTVLIYCPWDPEVQCLPAQVRIPTGCSCKQYTCDKRRAMIGGASEALKGMSSLTSRFRG